MALPSHGEVHKVKMEGGADPTRFYTGLPSTSPVSTN